MSLRGTLVAQFRRPQGLLGGLAGRIMANRASNIARNHWTVDLLDIHPGDRVLEIGCGPGIGLKRCLTMTGAGLVVGLDHSDVMIRQASHRNAAALDDGRLRLCHGDLTALSEFGYGFTHAFSVNVAQFFPDKVAAFNAVAEVLTPGGLLAVTHQPRGTDTSLQTSLAMAETLETVLEQAGFTQLRTEQLDLKPTPVICVIGQRHERYSHLNSSQYNPPA